MSRPLPEGVLKISVYKEINAQNSKSYKAYTEFNAPSKINNY